MTRRYPVRPKTGMLVLSALFFGVGAVVLFSVAFTNERGLVLFRLVHLEPADARVFYGVLAAASVAFVVAAFVALLAYRGRTHEVVVDDDGLTTPGPIWRLHDTRTVRFADVTEVRQQTVSGQPFMTLVTPSRKVWIAKSHLPAGAFEEIVAFVRQRVGAR